MPGLWWRQWAAVVSAEQSIPPVRHHVVERVTDLARDQVAHQTQLPKAAEVPKDSEDRGGTGRDLVGLDPNNGIEAGEFRMSGPKTGGGFARQRRKLDGTAGVDREEEFDPPVAEATNAVVEDGGLSSRQRFRLREAPLQNRGPAFWVVGSTTSVRLDRGRSHGPPFRPRSGGIQRSAH